MEREETAEGGATNIRSAQHDITHLVSKHRHAVHNGRANAKAPIGVLIPAHDLTSESQRQCAEQQQHANHPHEFTWKLERCMQKHLAHVDHHHKNHGVAAPRVKRPQHPTKWNLLIDVLQTAVRLGRAWHVHGGEQDSSDHLNAEEHQRGAAKHVPPLGVAWNSVRQDGLHKCDHARARLSPTKQTTNHLLNSSKH